MTIAAAPKPGTLEARNLAVIERMNAAFNQHDFETAVACHAPTFVNHGRPANHAIQRAIYHDIHTRFPDVAVEVLDCLAQGDSVVLRWLYRGTHLGKLPVDGGQMVGVAPTGRKFEVQHLHWFTLRDGLIVEHSGCRDDVGMLVQLGLLPEPPPFIPPA